MKVALCSIAKLENKYIREWVIYHLNIGFDHIFVYDNNDVDGERIIDAVKDFKDVTVLDVRGIKKVEGKSVQYASYTECYKKFGNDYDYMFFTDIDAFVKLEDPKLKIKDVLNSPVYSGFDQIRLFLRTVKDNNIIRVKDENYSVLERFTGDFRKEIRGCSFIKTKLPHIITVGPHGSREAKSCDVLGNEVDYKNYSSFSIISKNTIYEKMWVDHYYTKSIEEYLEQKLNRGYADCSNDPPSVEKFFRINDKTKEKMLFIKDWFEKRNMEVSPIVSDFLTNENKQN